MSEGRRCTGTEADSGGFFERLVDAPGKRQEVRRDDRMARELSSIKHHLAWLLNARRGCANSCPDLGLGDFNDASAGSADLLIRISADIRHCIEAFEPRVSVRDIRFCPDPDHPLELTFRLVCAVGYREQRFEIDLVMGSHNQRTRVV